MSQTKKADEKGFFHPDRIKERKDRRKEKQTIDIADNARKII